METEVRNQRSVMRCALQEHNSETRTIHNDEFHN